MKNILSILLLTLPFLGISQSEYSDKSTLGTLAKPHMFDMNISWEDPDGREFSINTSTGNLRYSRVSGDELEYNNGYSISDTGEKGTLRSVGDVKIVWNNGNSISDTGEKGTLRSVGDVKIVWNNGYSTSDTGPKGTLRSVGGLKVEYKSHNSRIMSGTSGSVY